MEMTFKVRREGPRIAWIIEGRRMVDFHWKAGDALCQGIRHFLAGLESSYKVQVLRIHWSNIGTVLIDIGGRTVLDMTAGDLEAVSVATRAQCRKAEEEECANQVAFDGALLLRTGAPFGMTDNPKIKEMVLTEASSNRTLRTALPGMKDTTLFGAPIVVQQPDHSAVRQLKNYSREEILEALKE